MSPAALSSLLASRSSPSSIASIRAAWLFLLLAANHVLLPLLLGTLLLAPTARAAAARSTSALVLLANVCVAWVAVGVAELLLYYVHEETSAHVDERLCVAQGALRSALVPMIATATLALVLHAWLSSVRDPQTQYDDTYTRTPPHSRASSKQKTSPHAHSRSDSGYSSRAGSGAQSGRRLVDVEKAGAGADVMMAQRRERWGRCIVIGLLVLAPYAFFGIFAGAGAKLGFDNPGSVARGEQFYVCMVGVRRLAVASAVIATLVCASAVGLFVHLLVRRLMAHQDILSSSYAPEEMPSALPSDLSRADLLRLGAYLLYVLAIVFADIVALGYADSGSATSASTSEAVVVREMFIAGGGMAVVVLFGLRWGILRTWNPCRPRPRTASQLDRDSHAPRISLPLLAHLPRLSRLTGLTGIGLSRSHLPSFPTPSVSAYDTHIREQLQVAAAAAAAASPSVNVDSGYAYGRGQARVSLGSGVEYLYDQEHAAYAYAPRAPTMEYTYRGTASHVGSTSEWESLAKRAATPTTVHVPEEEEDVAGAKLGRGWSPRYRSYSQAQMQAPQYGVYSPEPQYPAYESGYLPEEQAGSSTPYGGGRIGSVGIGNTAGGGGGGGDAGLHENDRDYGPAYPGSYPEPLDTVRESDFEPVYPGDSAYRTSEAASRSRVESEMRSQGGYENDAGERYYAGAAGARARGAGVEIIGRPQDAFVVVVRRGDGEDDGRGYREGRREGWGRSGGSG